MPDWPSGYGGTRLEAIGAAAFDIGVTAGSANAKGSWAELTSSSPIDADGFYLNVAMVGTNRDFLFDIGVGAAGSEVVILENVLVSIGSISIGQIVEAYVPLPIKAGTRIAARCQSTTVSAVLGIMAHLAAGDFYSAMRCGRATTYGALTADSGGTSIDPGAVASTKGSWVELAASLTNPFRSALVCVGNQANAVRSAASYSLDLGIGAAASEQVVLADNYMHADATTDLVFPPLIQRFLSAKSGERLAARAKSDITDATDRLFDLVVIGFD